MSIKNDRPGAFELSDIILTSYANDTKTGKPVRLN